MKPFIVDVPVLILFFNRPQQLSQVLNKSGMPVPPSFSSIRTDHAANTTCPVSKHVVK